MNEPAIAVADPWHELTQVTPARIALGRAGGSLPTTELLSFNLAHARARDAVHQTFDVADLCRRIEQLGLSTIVAETAAADRRTYLQRPDFGRRLSDAGRHALRETAERRPDSDLVMIVSDGLSALAAERQAVPVLEALVPALRQKHWRILPIVVVPFARVALQDEVGHILGAAFALTLIGERPGLGAPDSLSAYMVRSPAPGLTDANRNCVSNIRPDGLAPTVAAIAIHNLLAESRRLRISGVQLKLDTPALPSA